MRLEEGDVCVEDVAEVLYDGARRSESYQKRAKRKSTDEGQGVTIHHNSLVLRYFSYIVFSGISQGM